MSSFTLFFSRLFSQISSSRGSTAVKRLPWYKAGLTAAVLVLTVFTLSCGEAGGGQLPIPEEKPVIELSHIFSTGVTLTWTPPENKNITSYTITFRPTAAGDSVVINAKISQLISNTDGSVSYHAEGLMAETKYTVSLVPQTPQGPLEAIETKNREAVTTNRATKPSTPTDLAGELEAKTSSFTASLSWTAPGDPGKKADGQTAQITSYVLYWNPGDLLDAVPQRLSLPDSRSTYTLENLQGGSLYTLSITAINNQELESPLGLPLTLETPSLASPPGAVSSVDYQSQLAHGFTLTWNPAAPGRASTGAEITPQYKVYLSDSGTASAEEIAVEDNLQGSGPNPEVTISGLNEGSSYYLVINSFIQEEEGLQESLSPIIPVATAAPDDAATPPGAPYQLVQDLSNKDLFSLKLFWHPGEAGVTVDGSGEAETLYRVEYKKSGQTSWEETPELLDTTVVLTDLEGAEDYQIRVKALNSENKAKSSVSETATLKSNGIISITLTKDSAPIPEGSLTFTQTEGTFVLVPQFQTHNFESAETVNWTSSNTNTALVDNNGRVTLAGEGQTVIIAASTEDTGRTAEVSLTVDVPDLTDANIQMEYLHIDRTLDQGTAKIYPLTINAPVDFPTDQLQFTLGGIQESGTRITNPGFSIEDNGSLYLSRDIPPGEYELFVNTVHRDYNGSLSLRVNFTIRSVQQPLVISYGTRADARAGQTMVYPLDGEASTQPDGVVLQYALTSRDSQDISGISIDQDTGTITTAGTTAIGLYLLTVTVSTEDPGYSSGSLDLEIRVLDSPPLTGSIGNYFWRGYAGTQKDWSIDVNGLPLGISREDLTFTLGDYKKKTGLTTYEGINNPGFSISPQGLTAAETTEYGKYQVTMTAQAQDLGFSGEITSIIEIELYLTLTYGSDNSNAAYGETAVFSLNPPSLPAGTVMEYTLTILSDIANESDITVDRSTGAISFSGTGKPGSYPYTVTGKPENEAFTAKTKTAPSPKVTISGKLIENYLPVFQYETPPPAEYNENPPSSYQPQVSTNFGAAREDFSYSLTNAPHAGFQISSEGTLSVEGPMPLGTHQVVIQVTKDDAYGALVRTLSIEVEKNDLGNNLLYYGSPGRLSLGEEKNYPVISTTIPTDAALIYSLAPASPGDSLGGISIDQNGTINVPPNQNQGLYNISVRAVPGNTEFYQGTKTVDFLINVGASGTVLYKPDMEAGQDYFTLGDKDNPFLFEIQGAVEKTGLSARIVLKNAQDQTVLYDSGISDILTPAGGKVGAGPRFTGSAAVSAFQGVANVLIELTVSNGEGDFINQSLSKIWGGETSLYGWRDIQAIQNDLGGHYSLQTDTAFPSPGNYSLPAEGFAPLGSETTPFSGSLTGTKPGGGRYLIKDLRINRENEDNVGLFGYIQTSNPGDIAVQDLIFLDPVIAGKGNTGSLGGTLHTGTARGISVQLDENQQITTVRGYATNSGGIAGTVLSGGVLLNVDSQGHVSSSSGVIGGLAGMNAGRVIGHTTGTASGVSTIGGLVGKNSGEVIGYASGDVTGTGLTVGGLAGAQDSGLLVGYYTEGTVRSSWGVAGGLISDLTGGTVMGYITGSAMLDSNGGGLANYAGNGSILTGYSAAGHAAENSSGLILSNAGTSAVLRTYGDRTHSSSRSLRTSGTTTSPQYLQGISSEAHLIRLEGTPGNYRYYDNNGTMNDPNDDVELFEKTHGTENTPDFNFRQSSAGTLVNGLPKELGDWTWLGSGRWPSLWDTPEKTYFGDQPEYKVTAATE